jgi:hypothetical protein
VQGMDTVRPNKAPARPVAAGCDEPVAVRDGQDGERTIQKRGGMLDRERHTILLETVRLALRRFTPEDGDLLIALDRDPEVMRHISRGVPTPRTRIEQVVLPRWLAYY